ncbi:MAG: glucose-6-phosphate isomerase, partial [Myxococcota bacterium]|nr:glucose-6-phosphate isomerase [Myxococcota bacterium]
MSYDERIYRDPDSGLCLDLTDSPSLERTLDALGSADRGPMKALAAMEALEAGAMANPDEGRMVGHYWLRDPARAPDSRITRAILESHELIASLEDTDCRDVLLLGIGGSALGPQLTHDALRNPSDSARLHFIDNTDPEGFHRVLDPLDPAGTVVLTISKSGRTTETHNALQATRAHFQRAGVDFESRAVAITVTGSQLSEEAQGWRCCLPIWDWVGGRTSLTSAVGLAPMALCGHDWRGLLEGARLADTLTRKPWPNNPAALLALTWHAAGSGTGERALVVEPYRDRLQLLARYLQQLVMESLGKSLDRGGRTVHQGLTVYGNKGSTDQHAFMQQLRDGRDDALVLFVEVLDPSIRCPLSDGLDASDHLLSLMAGTRQALGHAGRPSMTLQVPDVSAHSLGLLVALFERAVGLYAELVNINAYHQPGVEAGKQGARETLSVLERLQECLDDQWRNAT